MRRTTLHDETKRDEANWLVRIYIPETEEESQTLEHDWEDAQICVCGHRADHHHGVWYKGGAHSRDECEEYGFNETGGMELVDDKWVEHCQAFRAL